MKSWILGIIMVVLNSVCWGALFLELIKEPSAIGWAMFICMSLLLISYIFGVIIDIQSCIDDKVEDEKRWEK